MGGSLDAGWEYGMKKSQKPPVELPSWALSLLDDTYFRIQNVTAARRLWDQVFTERDRQKCDDDLEAAYRHGGVIGMWRAARGGDADHALLDAARALGFLTDEYHDRLSRVCFGSGTKQQPDKPHWNKEARQLTFRGVLVREVKRPGQAANIVAILDAFEEAGWPPRIDDPRARDSSDETRRRDIENLNKLLLEQVMRFACDGTGTGFQWKSIEKPAAAKRSGTKTSR